MRKITKKITSLVLACSMVMSGMSMSSIIVYADETGHDAVHAEGSEETTDAVVTANGEITVLTSDNIILADDANAAAYDAVTVLDPFVWVNSDVMEYADYNTSAVDDAKEEIAQVAEDVLNRPATVSSAKFGSTEEAQELVKTYLKQHKKEFTVTYNTDDNSVKGMYNTAMSLFDYAMTRTGEPDEGQYISSQLYTYGCEITYTKADDGTYNTTLNVVTDFFSSEEQEALVGPAIDALLNEILEPCMSDYQRVKAIWDWMSSNITYGDPNQGVAYSAYAGLIEGACVCQGYSALFMRLAMEAGYDAWFLNNGINHAWNMVQLGDYYYNMDVTWGWAFRGSNNFPNHTRIKAWDNDEFNAMYPTSVTDYDTAADIPTNEEHHVWNDGEVVTEATCTENGLFVRSCLVCGETEETVIPNTSAHQMTYYPAQAATEDTAGNIDYWYCSECDTYYADADGTEAIDLADTVISATGHIITYFPASSASCSSTGHVAYWYCSECGTYFLDSDLTEIMENPDEAITPALGHVLTHYAGSDPKCDFPGIIEYWYCSRCNCYFSDESCENQVTTLTISALYHGYDWDTGENEMEYHEATPATDTEDGNMEYWYCPYCGNYYPNATGMWYTEQPYEYFIIPAGSQTDVSVSVSWTDSYGNNIPDEWLPESLDIELVCALENGTGTIAGTGTITKASGWTCTFEGVSSSISYSIIDPDGLYAFTCSHDVEKGEMSAVGVIPMDVVFVWTENEDGSMSCSVILMNNEALNEGEDGIIAEAKCTVTDHVFVEPSCTETGMHAYTAAVTIEGAVYTDTCEKEIDATGHQNVVSVDYSAPSLLLNGNIAYWYCKDCGHYYADADCEEEIAYEDTLIDVLQSVYYIDSDFTMDDMNVVLGYYAEKNITSSVTVILNEDTEGNLYVPEEINVVLNLNGKVLSGVSGSDTIYVSDGASLTVIDTMAVVTAKLASMLRMAAIYESGTVLAPGDEYAAVFNDGTVILNGGSFVCEDGSWYTIVNHGDMEINADVSAENSEYALIANGYAGEGRSAEGDAEKTAGLMLTGGTYTASGDAAVILNAAYAEIDGGYFDGTAVEEESSAETDVYGGTFTDAGIAEYIAAENGATGVALSSTGVVYVCGTEEVNEYVQTMMEEAEGAGIPSYAIIIEIVAGDAELTELDDVVVTNSGNGVVTADGMTVEPNESVHAHDMLIEVPEEDPTCTEEGNIHYWHCLDCDTCFADAALTEEIDEADTVIAALGHDNVTHVEAVEPTAAAEGNVEYWYCETCGRYYLDANMTVQSSETEVMIPEIGHEHSTAYISAKAATCTSDGNTAYWYCVSCQKCFLDEDCTDEIAKEDTVIPATGHDFYVVQDTKATCTESGIIRYRCPNCNNTYYIPLLPTGHSLTFYAEQDAGCTEDGHAEYWYCDSCGEYFLDENGTESTTKDAVVYEAAGHSLTHHEASAATCTEDGNAEYWTCDNCGIYLLTDDAYSDETVSMSDIIIPATGHEDAYYVPEKSASCGAAGIKAHWYCPECDTSFLDEGCKVAVDTTDLYIPPLEHSLTYVYGRDADCEEDGNVAHWECDICGKMWADQNMVDELDKDSVVLPALGHSLEYRAAKDASCTEPGNIEYWYCVNCGTYFTDADAWSSVVSVVIPAEGHNIVYFAQEDAGCVDDGHLEYWYCSTCDTAFTDKECTEIIKDMADITLPAVGHHDGVHVEAKEATAEDTGNLEYWYCNVCHKYFLDADMTEETTLEYVTVPVLGHVHSVVYVEAEDAACDADGHIGYWYCEECGKYFADADAEEELSEIDITIKALGHRGVVHVQAVNATEDAEGCREYWYCPVCGKIYDDAEMTHEAAYEDLIIPKLSVGSSEEDDENAEETAGSGASESDKKDSDAEAKSEKNTDGGSDKSESDKKDDDAENIADEEVETSGTGDNNHFAAVIAVMMMSGIAAAGCIIGKKRLFFEK